jgi:hypothetical protein
MAREKWRWGGRWRWVGDGEMGMFCTYGVNIFIDYHPARCDTEKGGIGGKRH